MKTFTKIFLFSLLFCVFLGGKHALASSLTDDITGQYTSGAAKAELGKVDDPRSAVTGLIKNFLMLLGSVFLILTVYAGFQLITAGGDDGKVEKAQKTIQGALIGLIIILAAYSITAFVTKSTKSAVTGQYDTQE